MMKIVRHSELTQNQIKELESLATLEFGHMPLVINTEWAKPHWTVLYLQNDNLVSFCNLIERDILVDKKLLRQLASTM